MKRPTSHGATVAHRLWWRIDYVGAAVLLGLLSKPDLSGPSRACRFGLWRIGRFGERRQSNA
jgi:hypothetical protein